MHNIETSRLQDKEQWLNEVFMPLQRFLDRNQFPDRPDQITKYLMFVEHNDGQYVYKNKVTRSYIVLDEQGRIIACAKDALNTLSVYKSFTTERKRRQTKRLQRHS